MSNAVAIKGLPPPASVRARGSVPLSNDCSVFDRLLPTETLLFSSDRIAVGSFSCGAQDPTFQGGMPSTAHCIVFSRTPVWIQHDGGTRYVADPTVVTFHTRGRPYRRWRVSTAGDRCDWIAFGDDVVREALRVWAPAASDADRVRFPCQYAAAASSLYTGQRRLFECLARGECDELAVDEQASLLLRDALTAAFRREGRAAPACHDAVQHAREIIARDPSASLRLADVARSVGLSPFQLCRAFVRATGETMTAYRLRLRLLTSLELLGTAGDLTSIALALGFHSHSHFTAAFRRAFGAPPSRLRNSGARAPEAIAMRGACDGMRPTRQLQQHGRDAQRLAPEA